MKRLKCPYCSNSHFPASHRAKIKLNGVYFRSSDETTVQRFYCEDCGRCFSEATSEPGYRQKKRHKNAQILCLLEAGISHRTVALIAGVNRSTVLRIKKIGNLDQLEGQVQIPDRNLELSY